MWSAWEDSNLQHSDSNSLSLLYVSLKIKKKIKHPVSTPPIELIELRIIYIGFEPTTPYNDVFKLAAPKWTGYHFVSLRLIADLLEESIANISRSCTPTYVRCFHTKRSPDSQHVNCQDWHTTFVTLEYQFPQYSHRVFYCFWTIVPLKIGGCMTGSNCHKHDFRSHPISINFISMHPLNINQDTFFSALSTELMKCYLSNFHTGLKPVTSPLTVENIVCCMCL